MKTRLYVGFVVFFWAFFILAGHVDASGTSGRYLINTSSSFARRAIGGIRHDFSSSFSIDGSPFQLRVAKILGYDVQKITVMEISSQPSVAIAVSETLQKNDVSFAEGTPIHVAVLDTGALGSHAALTRYIASCKDFTQPRVVPADSCTDNNGHGTHVAGIIASNARTGVALDIYKVCSDKGECYSDDIAAAIQFAQDQGIKVINIGFGSAVEDMLVHNSIIAAREKGIFILAPAGNGGPFENSVQFPASQKGVVAVGAFKEQGIVAEWSSRGPQVAMFAPGERILSTWKDGSYATLSGTSMATPNVTARVISLMNTHPEMSEEQILRQLHD